MRTDIVHIHNAYCVLRTMYINGMRQMQTLKISTPIFFFRFDVLTNLPSYFWQFAAWRVWAAAATAAANHPAIPETTQSDLSNDIYIYRTSNGMSCACMWEHAGVKQAPSIISDHECHTQAKRVHIDAVYAPPQHSCAIRHTYTSHITQIRAFVPSTTHAHTISGKNAKSTNAEVFVTCSDWKALNVAEKLLIHSSYDGTFVPMYKQHSTRLTHTHTPAVYHGAHRGFCDSVRV